MPQNKSVQPNTSKKSPALPIVFLLITAGILIVGGYLVYKTVNKSSGSPLSLVKNVTQGGNLLTPRAQESDFNSISDPLIRKHFTAQANTTSYRITSTSSGRGDKDLQIMEFVMQGNDVAFRMAQNMDGKPYSDLITIGDITYVKDMKDNSWWMQKAKPEKPGESKKEEDKYKVEDLKDEYLNKVDAEYTKLGEEACGALQCYKYQEVVEDNKEAKRIFWFDKKDLLLRREENGFGEFTSKSEYSYNITIKSPSPVKQVPEGKNIYEYMIAPSLSGDSAEMENLNKMMKEYESTNPTTESLNNEEEMGDGY